MKTRRFFLMFYLSFCAAFSMLFAVSAAQAQILTRGRTAPVVPEVYRSQLQQPPNGRVLTSSAAVSMPSSENRQQGGPVDLQADDVSYDEPTQTARASGSVILKQAGRELYADEVIYNIAQDQVTAEGNVLLIDANGDRHRAEALVLTDEMKNGTVQSLQTVLVDGSRFTAEQGRRIKAEKTVMEQASYTPCEPCEAEPDSDPPWQIRASSVTHDEENRRIEYDHARFEVFGVPVAYTPYFSHPDGSVERKSGLLAPSAGYRSQLGLFATSQYYYDIAPDQDATIGVMAMTEQNPLLLGEWRKRWGQAALELSGGVTYSERITRAEEGGREDQEELRGHLFGEGLWDINEKWRAGVNLEWASDDQYMRQYGFVSDDVLENELYAERFSGRNYSAARLLTFQDIRVRPEQEDQPEVLPEMISSFVAEPGSMPVIGGRWALESSFLGLRRSGDGPDMNRLSVNPSWYRRFVSDYGLLTTVNASTRFDLYNARDRDVSNFDPDRSDSSRDFRIYPQLHVQSSYPMVRAYETMQVTIAPVVALTAAPNIDVSDDIPNEDSRDVQIDVNNIFEPNRFPGLDRVEDQSRLTYGFRVGGYGYGGSYADVFLGQSYRLQEDDNPFPQGSGLNEQKSDIVGQVSARLSDTATADYRFQLDSDSLSSQRHELDATYTMGRFALSTNYLFAKALAGSGIDESREQVRGDIGYYFTPEWRGRIGAVQDLGQTPGLRESYVGLDYYGQCVFLSLTGQRNLTDDASGESDTEVVFRIGLKNLGEFPQSTYIP